MSVPAVHLTQQDFVSTFPWGMRGDAVRILQQEVENELLDAETLAAMAFLQGCESLSSQLDEAWKLLLNSQNHDVHVCLFDEVGIDWCQRARRMATDVRQRAGAYLAGKAGTGAGRMVANTLSWNRSVAEGVSVPGFSYAALGASGHGGGADAAGAPWTDWFETATFRARLLENGCLDLRLRSVEGSSALVGNLTLWTKTGMLDSATSQPRILGTSLSADGLTAHARIGGSLGDIAFVQNVTVSAQGIDLVTELDYGDGRFFGPEPDDIQWKPQRHAHYFQHERKLCLNCSMSDAGDGAGARLLYNSPFLTWPALPGAMDSLQFAAMEARAWGLAHFNIGQGGYHHAEGSAVLRHVLGFAPRGYVYGSPEKLRLSGKHVHRSRVIPYAGDWRKAALPLRAAEFNRPVLHVGSAESSVAPSASSGPSASLLAVDSNSTIATAMFERGGRLFVRLWEWAGQEDQVAVAFGGSDTRLVQCSHLLRPQHTIDRSFAMRPWEIKTVELCGRAAVLRDGGRCRAERFAASPEGWERKNLFQAAAPETQDQKPASDAPIYFTSGYHDGFVRPLEHPTDTMHIEMERVHSPRYRSYTSTWEIGGNCWDRIWHNEPEYIEKLKPFLKEGTIELVGGTWSEPLSLIVGAESNMRQFMYGLETFEKVLDYPVRIYMNQEHATFAQMPQILSSFGLSTIVNRTQWAPFGIESGLDAETTRWIGPDGSRIGLVPRYTFMDYEMGNHVPSLATDARFEHDSLMGHNRYWRSEERFKWIRDQAIQRGIRHPLITMLEDIWEPKLRSSDGEMAAYNSYAFVHFTTIARYLELLQKS